MRGRLFKGAVVCLVLGSSSTWMGDRLQGGVVEGEALILPHIFNVSGGDSLVVLQNLSASAQDLNVEFFAQDGSFFDLVTVNVAGLGAAQVATPAGPSGEFRGSVLIFGNARFTARAQWSFDFGGSPVAVGAPGIPMSRTSSIFQMPIGPVETGSLVGVAIENPGGTAIDCTVTYRNSSGQGVSEDSFSVPAFGQIAEFASGIGGGFEGSGTTQCNGSAAVTVVIQEQVNGFPTAIFAVPD